MADLDVEHAANIPPCPYSPGTVDYDSYWTNTIFALTKKDKGYYAASVYVTPFIAKVYYTAMGANRPEKESQTDRFVADNLNDEWLFHGSGMTFDNQGALIDSQHRLQMVIESGKGIWTTVAFNAVPEAKEVIDSGTQRNNADRFHIKAREENNKNVNRFTPIAARGIIAGSSTHVEKSVFKDLWATYKLYRKGIDAGTEQLRQRAPFRRAAVLGAYAVGYKLNSEKVHDLFHRALTLKGLSEEDNAVTLNRYLTETLRNSTQRNAEVRPVFLSVLRIIKAELEGTIVKKLNNTNGVEEYFGLKIKK